MVNRHRGGHGPTVAIIVPTCGRPLMLRRCLRSLARQTRQADEILVVEDRPGLDSGAIANEVGLDVRVVRNARRPGVSGARNTGLADASSDWLWFLDDDDELEPEAIERLADVVVDESNLFLCYVRQIGPLGEGRPEIQYLSGPKDMERLRTLERRPITMSQFAVAKSYADSIGGLDERLVTCGDIDFWLRAVHADARLALAPQHLVVKHEHSSLQLSRNLQIAWWGHRAFLRKWRPIMRRRVGRDAYAGWLTRRLEVIAPRHLGDRDTLVTPLGVFASLDYAREWLGLALTARGDKRRHAILRSRQALRRALQAAHLAGMSMPRLSRRQKDQHG